MNCQSNKADSAGASKGQFHHAPTFIVLELRNPFFMV